MWLIVVSRESGLNTIQQLTISFRILKTVEDIFIQSADGWGHSQRFASFSVDA